MRNLSAASSSYRERSVPAWGTVKGRHRRRAELTDAVLTNPFHVDGMATDLDRALRMPVDERCERHARLLTAVHRSTAITWAESFVAALQACRE